ncbi:hypothetical protein QBC39DRAFT_329543 [Podospora conica]|nr:hypothetical protein QBC39DRAFT_329543 [Schizothecium conicum]
MEATSGSGGDPKKAEALIVNKKILAAGAAFTFRDEIPTLTTLIIPPPPNKRSTARGASTIRDRSVDTVTSSTKIVLKKPVAKPAPKQHKKPTPKRARTVPDSDPSDPPANRYKLPVVTPRIKTIPVVIEYDELSPDSFTFFLGSALCYKIRFVLPTAERITYRSELRLSIVARINQEKLGARAIDRYVARGYALRYYGAAYGGLPTVAERGSVPGKVRRLRRASSRASYAKSINLDDIPFYRVSPLAANSSRRSGLRALSLPRRRSAPAPPLPTTSLSLPASPVVSRAASPSSSPSPVRTPSPVHSPSPVRTPSPVHSPSPADNPKSPAATPGSKKTTPAARRGKKKKVATTTATPPAPERSITTAVANLKRRASLRAILFPDREDDEDSDKENKEIIAGGHLAQPYIATVISILSGKATYGYLAVVGRTAYVRRYGRVP